MCKAALERFSTGLAAELYDDNIAVNALSPTRVVPTPGTIFHHLTTEATPAEPPAVMAEAALPLCHPEPKLTGRIAYSQELLAEFGVPVPVTARCGWPAVRGDTASPRNSSLALARLRYRSRRAPR